MDLSQYIGSGIWMPSWALVNNSGQYIPFQGRISDSKPDQMKGSGMKDGDSNDNKLKNYPLIKTKFKIKFN